MQATGMGDSIVIPGQLWLEHAKFVRQGSDLLLVGAAQFAGTSDGRP
jgi:hypothetical protein